MITVKPPNTKYVGQGIAFLWLIREHEPLSYKQLCEISANPGDSAPEGIRDFGKWYTEYADKPVMQNMLSGLLWSFINDEIIIAETEGELPPFKNYIDETIFRISPQFKKVIKHLDFDFSAYVAQSGYLHMAFPVFGSPKNKAKNSSDIFVIMPSEDHAQHLFNDAIYPTAEALALSCIQSEQAFSTEAQMTAIWTSIVHSRLCIVDCTGGHATVFYAMGIADTIGRKVILIAQSKDDIPFDVRRRPHVIYENTQDGLETLREKLDAIIKSELEL